MLASACRHKECVWRRRGGEQAGRIAPPWWWEGCGLAPMLPGGDGRRSEHGRRSRERDTGENLGDGKLEFGDENVYICVGRWYKFDFMS